jgi:hypothetical protein
MSRRSSKRNGQSSSKRSRRGHLISVLAIGAQAQAVSATVFPSNHPEYKSDYLRRTGRVDIARRGPPEAWNGRIPLKITNKCQETIWPGIATQHGVGPGTGGFELASGDSRNFWVGPTWQGRAWGRTNCTVNGDSCTCKTGDCFGKLDCEFTVSFTRYQLFTFVLILSLIVGCGSRYFGRV